mgnify:CR=1 FL=1
MAEAAMHPTAVMMMALLLPASGQAWAKAASRDSSNNEIATCSLTVKACFAHMLENPLP